MSSVTETDQQPRFDRWNEIVVPAARALERFFWESGVVRLAGRVDLLLLLSLSLPASSRRP